MKNNYNLCLNQFLMMMIEKIKNLIILKKNFFVNILNHNFINSKEKFLFYCINLMLKKLNNIFKKNIKFIIFGIKFDYFNLKFIYYF
jgi:hypothetical protein